MNNPNIIRKRKNQVDPLNPHSTSVPGPVAPFQSVDKVEIQSQSNRKKDLILDSVKNSIVGKLSISSIAPIQEWKEAIANGDINQQFHDTYPYSIVKYSQETVYKRNWNPVTRAARGLIFNNETSEIVARPFSKFFNYEEGLTPPELMRGPFRVSEKLDGSLGTSYLSPDGKFLIASSGSFNSDQAKHANELYALNYEGKWTPDVNLTYLFEIIYPENRIVVDYGDTDDLFLIGAIDKVSGKSIPLNEIEGWVGPIAEEHEFNSIEELAASPSRTNKEGYILHYVDTDARVKFKHEDYVKMHRVVTGVNSKFIWDILKEGKSFDPIMVNMPEEFTDYVTKEREQLTEKFNNFKTEILVSYNQFEKSIGDLSQKDFALKVQSEVEKIHQPYFYILRNNGNLDAPKVQASLWDKIKPSFERPAWGHQADSE